jgi:hypothetical protein
MSYEFKKAVREEVGLLIGLIGASGSGKTYSAMRVAAGIVGKGNRFAVIDTESRRALHYADKFEFDHCELTPPFRPDSYAEAIKAADKAGYKAIVVDSFSHEWAGEGGILDWQEDELQRMAGDDYRKREACKMAAWIKPKMSHKQMVQKLLQVRAHLILCFRAEEKTKMEKAVKDGKEKTIIVPIGFQPICSKELPFELTVSFLLLPDKPGIPQPLKLQEQHKAMFPLDKLLNEESGKAVSEWAKGSTTKPETTPQDQSSQEKPAQSKERARLEILLQESKIDRDVFKAWLVYLTWLHEKDGKLSMSNLEEERVKQLVSKWASAKKTFLTWVDTPKEEVNV